MSVFFLICSAQVYLSVCQVIYFIAQLAGLANIKSSSFCVYSCIYICKLVYEVGHNLGNV